MRRCERGGAAAIPVAALLAGLLLIAGCTPTPAPTKSSAAPSPSATPLFRTDAEALAAAKDAYQRFIDVSDEISHEGGTNPERLETVAQDPLLSLDLQGFAQMRSDGSHTVGNTRLAGITLQAVNSGSVVHAYICIDLSDVGVVDRSGTTSYNNTSTTRQTFVVILSPKGSNLLPSEREPWGGTEPCTG